MATVCQQFENRQIHFYCDSQPAITLCRHYINRHVTNIKLEHITNGDLISQGKFDKNEVTFDWVEGHAKNLLNNQCDLLAKVQNEYKEFSIYLNNQLNITFKSSNF